VLVARTPNVRTIAFKSRELSRVVVGVAGRQFRPGRGTRRRANDCAAIARSLDAHRARRGGYARAKTRGVWVRV
jgi:hypothetical protein